MTQLTNPPPPNAGIPDLFILVPVVLLLIQLPTCGLGKWSKMVFHMRDPEEAPTSRFLIGKLYWLQTFGE